MVFLNGNVYIIGGIGCSSVERYNLENNICQEVTKLNVSVHSPAVCVYGEDIYILGGKSLKGNVACVQKLDTRKNEIVNLNELPFPCSGGHAIVVKDTIYYATNYGHMIKFSPKCGQSQLCSHQPYRRKHFAMFQRNHELYIFGGVRTEGPVNKSGISDSENSLIKYCTDSDKWSLVHSYKDTVSVYTCCTVKYPKASPVKPFMKLFGYC
jgi:N-acetylneuraminic acid mutarotase